MSRTLPMIEIAVAAAEVEVPLIDGTPSKRVKLLPIGKIEMRDGRGPYQIRDRAHAEQVVSATQRFLGSHDLNFDYDHQVLYAAQPGVGGTAIAAGWGKPATLKVEDDGIYVEADWTPAATAKLVAREYRYISPLFTAAKDGGDVIRIKNAALVNIGAIDLPAIAAALEFSSKTGEDMTLTAIAASLGLGADATEAAIIAAIGDAQKKTATSAIAIAAGCAADADADTIAAAVEGLKKPTTSAIAVAAGLDPSASVETIAAAVGTIRATHAPDMSQYVPKSLVDPLMERVEKAGADRIETIVDEHVAAGILTPAGRKDALNWYKTDEVAASAFFAKAPKVVEPGAQFEDRKPGEKFTTLTTDEIAACAAIGQSHEDFLGVKNAEVA